MAAAYIIIAEVLEIYARWLASNSTLASQRQG